MEKTLNQAGHERAAELVQELAAGRKSAELNQEHIANAIGTSQVTVSQTELGKVSPRLALICSWAVALGKRVELVDELPTIQRAGRHELGAESTAVDIVELPGNVSCPACHGRGYVYAHGGERAAVIFEGQAILGCAACEEGE